jgi:hypothetical protein
VYTLLHQPGQWEFGAPQENGRKLGKFAWTAVSAATYQVFESISNTWSILNSSTEIISTLEIPELMDILVKELPRFGIHKCYIVLYECPPPFRYPQKMLPAAEVGGDYYDISKDLEDNLWLAIGDVSGHGVPSGLIMMMAQTIHTTITTKLDESPRDIVAIINKVLIKNISGRMGQTRYMTFTTLKYLGKGWFQYAGLHLDLLIYRYRDRRCELIETTGMWLNVLPDILECTKNKELFLDIGDVLVLFTDGITEVFNKKQVILDIHRFIDIVTSHGEKDVHTMQEAIFSDVLTWCYGEPKDDMTLVLIRRIS